MTVQFKDVKLMTDVVWVAIVKIPFVESPAAVTMNVLTMKNALKGVAVFSVLVIRAALLASFVNMDNVLPVAEEMQNVL